MAAVLLAGLGTLDLAIIDMVLAPQVVQRAEQRPLHLARTDVKAAQASELGRAHGTEADARAREPAPEAGTATSKAALEIKTDTASDKAPAARESRPSAGERHADSSTANDDPPRLAALENPARYALEPGARRVYNLQFPLSKQDWVPAQAKQPLETIARRIQASAQHRAIVRGHADARGSREANLELAAARAKVIADYLLALGVPAERLQTRALGESRPAVRGHNPRAWFRNRRVEVVLEPQPRSRR